MPGFGASDCTCGSHLIALGPVAPAQAFAELNAAFRNGGRPGSLTLAADAHEHNRTSTLEYDEYFWTRGSGNEPHGNPSLTEGHR